MRFWQISGLYASLLLSLATLVSAVDIKGKIVDNEAMHIDLKSLSATRVVLDDGTYSGWVTRNGNFHIPHVPPGTYILTVLSPQHWFDQLRIDVLPSSDLPEVRPYLPGTPLYSSTAQHITLPYPLHLEPKRKLDFFVPQESFNALALLKSPMVIMMIITAGMALGVPYLMKNLDPETLKEINEQHQKIAQVQSSGLSGLMNVATSGLQEEERPASGGKPKGGKAVKRR